MTADRGRSVSNRTVMLTTVEDALNTKEECRFSLTLD